MERRLLYAGVSLHGRLEVEALVEVVDAARRVGQEVGEVDADAAGADDRDGLSVAEPRLEGGGVVDDVGKIGRASCRERV